MIYSLVNENGNKFQKLYTPHHFAGFAQCYDRVESILNFPFLCKGHVLAAQAYLMDARALRNAALKALDGDPLFFVDRILQT